MINTMTNLCTITGCPIVHYLVHLVLEVCNHAQVNQVMWCCMCSCKSSVNVKVTLQAIVQHIIACDMWSGFGCHAVLVHIYAGDMFWCHTVWVCLPYVVGWTWWWLDGLATLTVVFCSPRYALLSVRCGAYWRFLYLYTTSTNDWIIPITNNNVFWCKGCTSFRKGETIGGREESGSWDVQARIRDVTMFTMNQQLQSTEHSLKHCKSKENTCSQCKGACAYSEVIQWCDTVTKHSTCVILHGTIEYHIPPP